MTTHTTNNLQRLSSHGGSDYSNNPNSSSHHNHNHNGSITTTNRGVDSVKSYPRTPSLGGGGGGVGGPHRKASDSAGSDDTTPTVHDVSEGTEDMSNEHNNNGMETTEQMVDEEEGEEEDQSSIARSSFRSALSSALSSRRSCMSERSNNNNNNNSRRRIMFTRHASLEEINNSIATQSSFTSSSWQGPPTVQNQQNNNLQQPIRRRWSHLQMTLLQQDEPVSLPNLYACKPPRPPPPPSSSSQQRSGGGGRNHDDHDHYEPTESFRDEGEDDEFESCCSNIHMEEKKGIILSPPFSLSAVPQTPEEATSPCSSSCCRGYEEEKTEEEEVASTSAAASLSKLYSSPPSVRSTRSLPCESSRHSCSPPISPGIQTINSLNTPSPPISPGIAASTSPNNNNNRILHRTKNGTGGTLPPPPNTLPVLPAVSPEQDPAEIIENSTSNNNNNNNNNNKNRFLRRSKNGSGVTLTPPQTPPLLAASSSLLAQQDSNDSWDMEAEDVSLSDKQQQQQQQQQQTTTLRSDSTSSSLITFSRKLSLNAPPTGYSDGGSNGCGPQGKRRNNKQRSVQFSHVHIRNYNVCIGDNPCCSYGPPISLDWDYEDDENGDIPLDVYEQHYQLPKQAQRRRSGRMSLVLSYTERRARLWRSGYTLDEIDKVADDLEREKWRQSMLGNLEPLYRLQEMWVLFVKPIISSRARKRRELHDELDYVEQLVREEHSQQSISGGDDGDVLLDYENVDDSKHVIDLENQQQQQQPYESKAVLIEGIASLFEQEKQLEKQNSSLKSNSAADNSGGGGEGNKDYGIRVDKKQHDKATEIILCSLRRPHMRAFHASWFSFFVAFFSWFSIAPLLSEVKETLGLDNADIWMSSLFATAGTIVFRILMGPACDAWGARVCMSAILAAAAIPTALTGLVQTSAGLSLVRLFIGLAGSSFVACQYWTSEMFSRETAGTANALVAGWGNFGGGVTNLIMGSALFPLFRWFYRREDEDGDDTNSAELAWRTIFVVPAGLSLVTAALIFFYCDDSPTGSYQERIRNESLLMASPMESLRKAVKNWNVWILTFQYACCFGVEVTMTNATALYFKDEYGQSTVSAAGIASIFGFMNLFARGLGGFWSDKFQNMHGVKGRLFWQMLTLILEGIGIGIFGFADTLAGSIIALIFLSCMVQSAEGSTFGIVPYVDRRFTGSVVGIVGSGGNFGAAIFAIFFVYFSYTTAFIMMGLSAIGSAFLSLLMKTEKLAKTYEAIHVALEVEERKFQEEEEAKRETLDKANAADAEPKLLENQIHKEMDQCESRFEVGQA